MVGSRGVGKGDGAWVALCRQILRDLASPPPPPTQWFSCILSVDADDFLGVFIFIISSFFFPLALCSVSFMIFFFLRSALLGVFVFIWVSFWDRANVSVSVFVSLYVALRPLLLFLLVLLYRFCIF